MSDTNQKPEDERDERVDEGVEETFPASDPPAVGGSTGPDDDDSAPAPRGPAGS
jgi:hypothetical protein